MGHDIVAGIAFGGYIISLLGFGMMILKFDISVPKYLGFGCVFPFASFIIFCIVPSSLLEWTLLFSIIIASVPLYVWQVSN